QKLMQTVLRPGLQIIAKSSNFYLSEIQNTGMLKKILKVNPSDNVAVALVNLNAGDVVSFEGTEIKILSYTKSKHKIALEKFEPGDRIIMYGVLVGSANNTIEKG